MSTKAPALEFSASCALQHQQMLFSDTGTFETHMRAEHKARKVGTSIPIGAPRKRPAPSQSVAYDPGELSPGQPVHWHDTLDGDARDRSGTIWSAGPAPNTLWVIPDDHPDEPVAVRPKAGNTSQHTVTRVAEYSPAWQRKTIRRCENVRRFGTLYPVAHRRPTPPGRRTPLWGVTWHADPDCVDAAGNPHPADAPAIEDELKRLRALSAHVAVDVFLGRTQPTPPGWCQRCVWLTSPTADDFSAAAA